MCDILRRNRDAIQYVFFIFVMVCALGIAIVLTYVLGNHHETGQIMLYVLVGSLLVGSMFVVTISVCTVFCDNTNNNTNSETIPTEHDALIPSSIN